ncbi:tripartite tricarboxylate transporter substrate binding protein [Pusillimonas sp. SM2304]|uniref:Bug family tripartite tricarboxylate transporter substrate binding protein n=1 Tax=Pusillimonas sp. SM2304 TaxID=3073241 RepID=UPI0028757D6D|nr:tripartite tricarboxylate transporter substrate binding protein [Pusillimonas sp. SM2304]MDS1139782.1 tripartite tricarboxylate transporter substrate binding protein [Pusillimonas sp. SM2304]
MLSKLIQLTPGRLASSLSICALVAAAPLAGMAHAAESYPDKPIRLIIPYPPGGATDVIGRIVGKNLSDEIGQQVVIENRGGAGGNIGAGEVARAKPDGYTLLMGALTSHSVMATLEKGKLQYDLEKDLTPVGIAGSVPLVAVVNPKLPINSLNELVSYAKENPGKLNFASSGAGAPQRMAMELFKQIAGVNIVHVAYRGSGPAMTDLVGGQVETMTETVPAAIAFIKSGQLRPLAVLTPERISMLPDVPTAQEQGLTGFNVSSLFGVMAPTGTAPEIVDKLNAALVKALSKDEVRSQLLEQGVYASPMSVPESQKRLKSEIDQWAKVIHDGKITVN